MENIHVSIRPRPLSPEEAKTSPWRIAGNSISNTNLPYKFMFDRIFRDDCTTQEVYESRIREIIAAALRGYNGTVCAYGQTNSGKTHTMRGSSREPGIISLSVSDLFDSIRKEVDLEFLLRMSYMEIYNEEIYDLLAPEHWKLQIHENPERGIYVADLREEKVKSSDEVLNLMQFGEAHRHSGKTNMNVCSSRSHTIFRMLIEIRDKTGKSSDAVRLSVLNLVDLAGWERAAKTKVEGIRLKEGCHINKSLMTLRTVIKKLSAGAESQGEHVPFRDSKLTRILQPALGGNSNTAIICNITLAQSHADETKSSLKFASRALRIKSCAHVNEILTDAVLLKRQQKEIEELKAKLQGSHSEHSEKILNLQNALHQSELEREQITLELEVEKKAQAECERHLQEQAKKIEKLSSIVLYSNREDNRQNFEKCRRRHTWCPGNLSRETLVEAYSLPNILQQEKEQDDGFAAFSAGRRGLDASGGTAKNTLGAATTVAPDVLCLPMKEMLLEKDERREVGKTYGGSKFAVIREYLEIFNTGSREELMGIMRIGEKKATEIIEYREQNQKPFRELKDLESLHISTKLIKKLLGIR